MSQIINAIPPDALLPVAGALVGWVGHMLWFRSERAHVAAGMARIRQFMRGNDEWLSGQQRRFASAPSDQDVTGELLAVEPGRTYVVGENGPVLLALSDRPAADEDEVGDEQPGEATAGAPAKLWHRICDWLGSLTLSYRQRNLVGSGEQATAGDLFERFRIDDNPRGRTQPLALSAADEAELDEQWRAVAAAARAEAEKDGHSHHWNGGTAVHEQVYQGRRRAAEIPAQRTGDADE